MRASRLLSLWLLLAVQAMAQPGPGAAAAGARGERGDRAQDRALDRQPPRGDLRGELRAARDPRPAETDALSDPSVPARHLTPRERAEMREQLRRESSLLRARAP